jgi:hypothetical protein
VGKLANGDSIRHTGGPASDEVSIDAATLHLAGAIDFKRSQFAPPREPKLRRLFPKLAT